MTIIWIKLAGVTLLGALLALSLWLVPRLSQRAHDRMAAVDIPVLWLLTRLLPIVVVYVVAGFAPESDVATCFWPQAVGALSGQVPYRDFESFFGPLFPYLLAVPVAMWHDPRALVLWMTILESATVWLTTRAAGLNAPGTARTRFLLCAYLAPGPLFLEVIGGQEDFLLWTFGLLAWLALRKMKDSVGAVWTVAAMLCTKAVFLLPLAGFFGISKSRWRYAGIVVCCGALIAVVLFKLTDTAFLSVLSQSGNISPPQIWLLLHFLSGGFIPAGASWIAFATVAVLLGLASWGGVRQAEQFRNSWRHFAAGWTLIFSLLIVLSPKGQGAYLAYLFLPTLGLVIGSPMLLSLWVVAGAIAAVEPSLFYRLGEPQPSHIVEVTTGWAALNLAFQAVLVGIIFLFAHRAWRCLRKGASAEESPVS